MIIKERENLRSKTWREAEVVAKDCVAWTKWIDGPILQVGSISSRFRSLVVDTSSQNNWKSSLFFTRREQKLMMNYK